MADEMISRTDRAFSRAARTQDKIELGFFVSNVRKRMTVACVASPCRSAKSS